MTDLIRRADAIEAVNKEIYHSQTDRKTVVAVLSSLPSAEAVSRTSKGICAVCERKQVCEDGNRNVDMIGCSRFELDTHYNLSAETSQNLAKPRKELKGSDLISRDVVLANINERLRANGYGNVGLVSELNRLIGYVRNIPSAEAVQGWIPCSERLPDVDVEVLATVDWSEVLIAWLRKDGTWETGEYILASDEILAWMPLPTPYKGGDSE